MDKPVADAILAAADNMGLEMSLREEYSGRSMYGKSTTAVVYEDTNDLLQAVAMAAIDLQEAEEPDVELTAENFIEDLRGFRYDNMGRSSIVY